jgi:hypothetical protein
MAAERKKMSSEKYFLRYAYPCSFVLVDLGKISDAKRKELEKKLLKNESVSKKELEKIFVSAFRRLKQIAKERGRNYWDLEIIKEYFFGEKHNDFIDKQEGMYSEFGPTLRELCKVHKAEVIEKRGNILTVKYNGIARNVFATLTPKVKVGDKVTVHWAFAIEKLD